MTTDSQTKLPCVQCGQVKPDNKPAILGDEEGPPEIQSWCDLCWHHVFGCGGCGPRIIEGVYAEACSECVRLGCDKTGLEHLDWWADD